MKKSEAVRAYQVQTPSMQSEMPKTDATDEIMITDADLDEEEDGPTCCEPTGPVVVGKKKTVAKKGASAAPKKKSSTPKITPIILKQRKEVVEKRIQQLEVRLNRDKGILQRYAEDLAAAEAALEAAAKAAKEAIVDESTREAGDAVVV